jgi:hypothetical protein
MSVIVHLVTRRMLLRVMYIWIYTLVIVVFDRLTTHGLLHVMYNLALYSRGVSVMEA